MALVGGTRDFSGPAGGDPRNKHVVYYTAESNIVFIPSETKYEWQLLDQNLCTNLPF